LLVIFYGFETWTLILSEENRLKVSENRVLRIFGLKWDEILGGWRIPNNDPHNVYSSPNIFKIIKSRRIRWAEHVACLNTGIHKGFYVERQKKQDH
jgi:hypothetical protein